MANFMSWLLHPGTHWIGGSVGTRAGLKAVAWRKNPNPYRESNPGCPPRNLDTMQTERDRVMP